MGGRGADAHILAAVRHFETAQFSITIDAEGFWNKEEMQRDVKNTQNEQEEELYVEFWRRASR
jgi:hypothetical protein